MTDRTLTLYTEDGKETLCDILFTYFAEDFNKNYVVFKVRQTGVVSAAIYDEKDGGNGELQRIETEEEWDMLEELLDDYANNNQDSCSSCGGSCEGCQGCSGDCDCECGE